MSRVLDELLALLKLEPIEGEGRLVASVAQEGLVRVREDKR